MNNAHISRALIINAPWDCPQAHLSLLTMLESKDCPYTFDKVIFMGPAAPLSAHCPSSILNAYLRTLSSSGHCPAASGLSLSCHGLSASDHGPSGLAQAGSNQSNQERPKTMRLMRDRAESVASEGYMPTKPYKSDSARSSRVLRGPEEQGTPQGQSLSSGHDQGKVGYGKAGVSLTGFGQAGVGLGGGGGDGHETEVVELKDELALKLNDYSRRYRAYAQLKGIPILVCGMAAKRFWQDPQLQNADGLELTGFMEVLALLNDQDKRPLVW